MSKWRVMREEIPDLFHPGTVLKVVSHAYDIQTGQTAHPVKGGGTRRHDEYWEGPIHGTRCDDCLKKVGRRPKD